MINSLWSVKDACVVCGIILKVYNIVWLSIDYMEHAYMTISGIMLVDLRYKGVREN